MIDAGAIMVAPAQAETVAIRMPPAAKTLPESPWAKLVAVAMITAPIKIIAMAPMTARFTPHLRTASPMGTATRMGLNPAIPVYIPTCVSVIAHAFLIGVMTGAKELASMESIAMTNRSRMNGNIQFLFRTFSEEAPDDAVSTRLIFATSAPPWRTGGMKFVFKMHENLCG
jgi:hypothetical protein